MFWHKYTKYFAMRFPWLLCCCRVRGCLLSDRVYFGRFPALCRAVRVRVRPLCREGLKRALFCPLVVVSGVRVRWCSMGAICRRVRPSVCLSSRVRWCKIPPSRATKGVNSVNFFKSSENFLETAYPGRCRTVSAHFRKCLKTSEMQNICYFSQK